MLHTHQRCGYEPEQSSLLDFALDHKHRARKSRRRLLLSKYLYDDYMCLNMMDTYGDGRFSLSGMLGTLTCGAIENDMETSIECYVELITSELWKADKDLSLIADSQNAVSCSTVEEHAP